MQNHVAVVTGASRKRGVGAAVALLLANRGYDLLLNCHKASAEAEVLQSQCSQLGVHVELVVGDLSQDATCELISKKISEKWGKVDVLVNCLGKTKSAPYSQLGALKKEDFLDLYSVNVVAPYMVVKTLEPFFRKARTPSIVNISSAAGLTGKGSSIAYAAAKGGENTLTLALARALAPDIRVNAICPSFIDSSWWDDSFKGREEEYKKLLDKMQETSPLKRVLTPDTVAKEVLNLIDNLTLTGEIVRLSCGSHL